MYLKSYFSGIYCCFYIVAMATDNQRQYFLKVMLHPVYIDITQEIYWTEKS